MTSQLTMSIASLASLLPGQPDFHSSILTLLAVAEKALRCIAAPRTDCETFRAANILTVTRDRGAVAIEMRD